MPVRYSGSSVLRWPDREEVDRAARAWLADAAGRYAGIVAAAYFGSYARGDWGVGSDLDLVLVVRGSDRPFSRRSLDFDLLGLPVPAELLVYTEAEWQRLLGEGNAFVTRIAAEAVWLLPE